jgi:C-terminal processing protease CtpA/Prc
MSLFKSALTTAGGFFLAVGSGMALEIPSKIVSDLGSQQFRQRETAQAELLVWARGQAQGSVDALYEKSSTTVDPEVRQRLMTVLRELIDDQYLKEGKGYIGIGLRSAVANVPGEPKPRGLVHVTQIQPNSPGERAGLKVDDLIVSLNGEVWQDELANEAFSQKIAGMKPDDKVRLRVLRNQNLLDLEVILCRRPAFADNLYFDQRLTDADGLERAAKEAHFRQWMRDRKTAN